MTRALDTQVSGNHYKDFKIQPLEFIFANDLDFLQGNIVKYTLRHKYKNGAEDLDKVIHYATLLKEFYYGDDTTKKEVSTLYENARYYIIVKDGLYVTVNKDTGVEEFTHTLLPTSLNQADAMMSALEARCVE